MWRQYKLLVYASSFIGIDDIDVPEKLVERSINV
jgi:hypothetical protein